MKTTRHTFATIFTSTILSLFTAIQVSSAVPAPANPNPQSTPEAALQIVFDAVRSGELVKLKSLLPPKVETDGDVIELCMIANASSEKQQEFTAYFRTAKITGDARIDGDRAEVDFTFGPVASPRKETMHLTKVEGRWYLQSF